MAPELKVVAPVTLVRDAEEGIFPVKTKDVCVCVCVCVCVYERVRERERERERQISGSPHCFLAGICGRSQVVTS